MFRCYLHSLSIPLSVGSIGDLDGGEDNLPDDVSLSGEEAGASDQDDSAECDEPSPSFVPLYNEGKKTVIVLNDFCPRRLNYSKMTCCFEAFAFKWSGLWSDEKIATGGNLTCPLVSLIKPARMVSVCLTVIDLRSQPPESVLMRGFAPVHEEQLVRMWRYGLVYVFLCRKGAEGKACCLER